MCECKQVVGINYLQVHEERIQSMLNDKTDKNRYFSISYINITGQERLIRSHLSARFCFELSGNSN